MTKEDVIAIIRRLSAGPEKEKPAANDGEERR
jgi:hypothetical protein